MKKFVLVLLTIMFTNIVSAENTISGIGAGLFKEPYNHKTIIYKRITGSPASVIPVGSEIIKIDGVRTRSLPFREVQNRLLGDAGTTVTLITKDYYNKKHEYVLTRQRIVIPEEKVDERFNMHWQQVAPAGYDNLIFEPNDIINKLSYTFMLSEGNKMQYWADRKRAFRKGYNACLSYPVNEQNTCLMNLVNREINKTEHAENLNMQQNIMRQQAIQNINTNMQLQDINNNLRNINNNLRY